MRRTLFALALIFTAAPVLAQQPKSGIQNFIAPTPPAADNSDRIATTAYVQNSLGATSIIVGTSAIVGGATTRVLFDNAGVFGEYTAAQLTAQINAATASLSGALPAWPNNTTTYFRGDGTYATLNCAALTTPCITANQTITLSGDATGSGTTAITVTNVNLPTGVTIAGNLLATNITAPSTPASGKDILWTDSTDLRLHDKNASGVIGTTVVADTGASNNFLTAISAAGAISKARPTCASLSDSSTGCSAAAGITALTGDVTASGPGSSAATVVNLPTGVTQAGTLVGTNVAAPSTPASAHVSTWMDSTDLRLHDKNASGVIGTTVVADTGTANNYISAISAAGAITKSRPACATLSDSGTACTAATGTSGATLPFLNGNNTFSGTNNFTSTFQIGGNAMTFPAAAATLTRTIASGAKALATSAISSAACTSAQTDTATGTLTTDTVTASFNGDPTAVTGYVPLTTGMLTIIVYPTADTVNFKVCNNTASSITPGAITLNWRVAR